LSAPPDEHALANRERGGGLDDVPMTPLPPAAMPHARRRPVRRAIPFTSSDILSPDGAPDLADVHPCL
jgi:hypothetical protein